MGNALAIALAERVGASWEAWITAKGRRLASPHPSVWASAWRPCERRMVYELTCPETAEPFGAPVLARFRRGDDRERDLLADLGRIGRDADPAFEVSGQQERFALKDRRGRVAIVGKVDARIAFEGHGVRAPLEVKAWAPNIVDRIETFRDLFESPWTRSGAFQLLSYLYGAEEPFGFLLLDRSGLPLVLPVELDSYYGEMEEFLSRAERVLDHIEAGTLPAFIEDASECNRCPFFGRVCDPPLAATEIKVLTDPAIEADLERWHALKPYGKEWAGLDADLKRKLRGTERGVCGHFSIAGTWGKSTRLDVPDHLRKQFTVSDPRGRFTLEIERL